MRINPRLDLEGRPIGGLSPREWIVVDQGVSREEVKEYFLLRGVGFTASAILDVRGLCRQVLGAQVDARRILSGPARQEVLRRLLGNREKTGHLVELKRLRRQQGFYKKLDRSLQRARNAFSSLDELRAQLERLSSAGSRHPTRDELRWVMDEYESWLQENQAWDQPRLLQFASGVLSFPDVEVSFPEKITLLSATKGEGRLEMFVESLRTRTEVERIVLSELGTSEIADSAVDWQVWHTLDDAVERIADELHAAALAGELSKHGVLIPDVPIVRRSLTRALRERGVLPEDPRDPTRLRFEEGIKQAFLPLDLIARNFERELAVAYLLSPFCAIPVTEAKLLEQEIADQGILQGLGQYSSGRLRPLREEWEVLRSHFRERMTVPELKEAHLELLKDAGELRLWVREFFRLQWEQFENDLLVVEGRLRKGPPRYWIERLRARVEDASPPVERVKWRGGLQVYRLGQRPLQYPENLWALGLPARYTTEEEKGDYWLSARERDILSGHFSFRSSFQLAAERKQELLTWFGNADRVTLMDAQYDAEGREREGLKALLEELGIGAEPVPQGGHARWLTSYAPPSASSARECELKPLDRNILSASELEHVSRCEFRGMVMGRWKLKEGQEADLELRADARGTLLHEAIRVYLERRAESEVRPEDLEAVVETAWARKPPKGVFRSEKLIRDVKQKLLPILRKFAEQEDEYLARSGRRILSLEGPELRLRIGDLEIKGIPDRIDEVGDGLVLIDYKTSSANPSAKLMIELGYRLQMPIYALAAQAQLKKKVIAAQFIELSRKGGRTKGIFPVACIGDETGKVVKITKRSQSYVDRDAQEVWSDLYEHVLRHLERYRAGKVRAEPKRTSATNPYQECSNCPVIDVCGQRRRMAEEEGEGDEPA